VNAKEHAMMCHTPHRVDATSALKAAANQIVVKPISSRVNLLVGDLQPDATTENEFTD
jgi:hypothetical protein